MRIELDLTKKDRLLRMKQMLRMKRCCFVQIEMKETNQVELLMKNALVVRKMKRLVQLEENGLPRSK